MIPEHAFRITNCGLFATGTWGTLDSQELTYRVNPLYITTGNPVWYDEWPHRERFNFLFPDEKCHTKTEPGNEITREDIEEILVIAE